ncbi:hypothetical protein V8C35DRAFT_219138 [Trichoderma chlorosporum]
MRFFAPLVVLLVGVASASQPMERQTNPNCADLCYDAPLPCPANEVSQEINGCWTCCSV